jgi:hypothetical protein
MSANQFWRDCIEPCSNGSIAGINTLLEKIINIEFYSEFINHCLVYSAAKSQWKLVEHLLNIGANINAKSPVDNNVLIFAVSRNNLDMVKLLVGRGADVNQRIWNNSTPLIHAATHNYQNISMYLVSVGADLTAKDLANKSALTHYGKQGRINNYPYCVDYCVSQLEECWKNGPHPSQVLRRKDEMWQTRRAIMMVLAENGFRPVKNTTNNTDLLKTPRNDVFGNTDLSYEIVKFV